MKDNINLLKTCSSKDLIEYAQKIIVDEEKNIGEHNLNKLELVINEFPNRHDIEFDNEVKAVKSIKEYYNTRKKFKKENK